MLLGESWQWLAGRPNIIICSWLTAENWLAGRTEVIICCWLRADSGWLGVLRLSDVAG